MRAGPLGTASLLALGVMALLPAGGCGSSARECTVADCHDGVTFRIEGLEELPDGAVVVDTCVGGVCDTQTFDIAGQDPPLARHVLRTSPPGTYEPGDRLKVSAVVTDADGRDVAALEDTVLLEAHQPNGSRCPPTCAIGSVEVAGGRRER